MPLIAPKSTIDSFLQLLKSGILMAGIAKGALINTSLIMTVVFSVLNEKKITKKSIVRLKANFLIVKIFFKLINLFFYCFALLLLRI